jgi:hypothetical protein
VDCTGGSDEGTEAAAAGSVSPSSADCKATSDGERAAVPRRRLSNLTVTVTNQHAFPVRIVAVRPAAGQVIADARHRDAGAG